MGIRFHCPQGHKLNVKSFLAGKKGVCPKCGTKLRIPEASEPGVGDDGDDSDAGKLAAGGNGSATATAVITKVSAATAAGPMVAAAPASQPDAFVATGSTDESDPIAQAPAAVWYVRPPTGGQYGPARGDIFRRWIGEGRVSSDSLVWREGWSDWRTAGQLFPSLNSAAGVISTPVVAAAAPVRSASNATRYRTKKSGGSGVAVAALVVLGILCVVLVGVLVYVLTNLQ
jgi:hypothetical protein